MSARMTSAAWQQGKKNALICGVGVLVAWAAIAAAISLIFGQPPLVSFEASIVVLSVLSVVGFLGTWFRDKKTAGPVVLDCGVHPNKTQFLSIAVISLLIGTSVGVAIFLVKIDRFNIRVVVFGITAALFWLIAASGRLQIRENGIWLFWGLLKWSKLQSYHWEGDADCTLVFQVKKRFSLLGKGAAPVPIEHQKAVDDLLKKYVRAVRDA